MISAFGIDHGDDVAKSAPSAVKAMLRAGKMPTSQAGKTRAFGITNGNAKFGGAAKNKHNFRAEMTINGRRAERNALQFSQPLARANSRRLGLPNMAGTKMQGTKPLKDWGRIKVKQGGMQRRLAAKDPNKLLP